MTSSQQQPNLTPQRYSDHFSVGLTGGIGSGKTTVSNAFARLGITILDADIIAHKLSEVDQLGHIAIVTHFGESILNDDRTINRSYLREQVFNNPQQKKLLESILHPLIRAQMATQASESDSVYLIFSIPLLIETAQQNKFDRVLVIEADIKKRKQWIKSRSGMSTSQIDQIISQQTTSENRIKLADDIIYNDKTTEHLEQQVLKLHQKYLNAAQSKAP